MPIQTHQYKPIAKLLCDATEEVLWVRGAGGLAADPGRHQVHCRVGAGEATYYRDLGANRHLINYGLKMVASKHNPEIAAQWRTGREILGRGYFDGKLSLSGLLAHTCCHEFSHAVQSINGWIRRGSIHNQQFYHIVDSIHHSGLALEVRSFIEQRARAEGLSLAFSPAVSDSQLLALRESRSFEPGELVSFEYRGEPMVGEVLRVNRKTVNVKPVRPAVAADYFRISPQFLSRHQ